CFSWEAFRPFAGTDNRTVDGEKDWHREDECARLPLDISRLGRRRNNISQPRDRNGARARHPERRRSSLPPRRPVREAPQADGRLGRVLGQGRDGRGQGGRARLCANTTIAPTRRGAGLARRRTPHHRRPACPAPSHHVGGEGDGHGTQTTRVQLHWRIGATDLPGGPLQVHWWIGAGRPGTGRRRDKQAVEKIWLLFKHYKIDPNNEQSWQELALSLALAHVPGLQIANRPKSGRKPKTGLYDELVRAVDDVKSRTGKGTKEAIAELRKSRSGKPIPVEYLSPHKASEHATGKRGLGRKRRLLCRKIGRRNSLP